MRSAIRAVRRGVVALSAAVLVGLVVAGTAPGPAPAYAQDGSGGKDGPKASPSAGCTECHGDHGKSQGKFVDGGLFDASVHGGKDGCARCHFNYESYPHGEDKETAGCTDCHEAELEAFKASVHGKAAEKREKESSGGGAVADATKPRPPECRDCHGVHDVFRKEDRRSKLFPLEAPRTCGSCHFDHPDAAHGPVAKLLEERYADDTHGRGLLGAGLVVAPSCVSCHGGHEIRAKGDPESRVHPSKVAETCGTCHLGILEEYRTSVHGSTPRGREGHPDPASCTDCHQPHRIEPANPAFRLAMVETCSRCHGERGATFRGTFHGKMTDLGNHAVATCADCHTAHAMLPASDPRSTVHPDNRLATCRSCHPGASAAFADFAVHADAHDAAKWPLLHWFEFAMRWILNGTWIFGGLHMLLWLQRGLRDRALVRRPQAVSGGGRPTATSTSSS